MSDVKNAIINGKTVLGIEFGSTRIKAVLIAGFQKFRVEGKHSDLLARKVETV